MSTSRKDNNGNSASILTLLRDSFGAASVAGLIETSAFHPFDTMSKRLQKSEGKFCLENETKMRAFSRIALKAEGRAGMPQIIGLYSGLGWGLGYKFIQRGFKIGLQKPLQEEIQREYGQNFQAMFGARDKVVTQGLAGMILGIGEIVLLPLDAYKIKSQTNKEAYKGMSVMEIAREGHIFKGITLTIMRNAIGSFALFAVPEILKTDLMGHDTDAKISVLENVQLKMAGAASSIIVSSPADVVRTRALAEKANTSSIRLGLNMFSNEGIGSFFKGSLLKVIMRGPQLAFAMCITDSIIDMLKEHRESNENSQASRLR
jgi:hypothetical protein